MIGGKTHSKEAIDEMIRQHKVELDLLRSQNDRLNDALLQQVDSFKKKQKSYIAVQRQLREQIQTLKQASDEKQADQGMKEKFQALENEHASALKEHRDALLVISNQEEEIARLKGELETMLQLVDKEEQAKNSLEKKLRLKQRDVAEFNNSIQQFRQSFQVKEKEFQAYCAESEAKRQECLQEIEELKQKVSRSRRKRKELEAELEHEKKNLKELKLKYENQAEQDKSEMIKVLDQSQMLSKQLLSARSKIQFLSLELSKKEKYIEQEQNNIDQRYNQLRKQQAENELELVRLQTQNKKYATELAQLHKQMLRAHEQYRQAMLSYELTFKSMKDKVLMEVIQAARNNEESEELMNMIGQVVDTLRENCVKEATLSRMRERLGAKESEAAKEQELNTNVLKTGGNKSSTKLLNKNSTSQPRLPSTHSIANVQQGASRIDFNIQRIKYQNQINLLQTENSFVKHQVQDLRIQIQSLKSELAQSRNEVFSANQKAAEARTQQANVEKFLAGEIKKAKNDLQVYKRKDIQQRHHQKDEKEVRELFNLKIANYELKVKELVQALERKDALVQSLKQYRKDSEEAIAMMEEKLKGSAEEISGLRRQRVDIGRKDQLLKQYKTKLEYRKQQVQNLKADKDRLKKQNQRLEREVQRKSEYIDSLKNKYEKELNQIERKLKSSSKETRVANNTVQQRISELKRHCSEYEKILNRLKQYISQATKRYIDKAQAKNGKTQGKVKRKKVQLDNLADQTEVPSTNPKYWQATKVLGLKENQLQEFLNPIKTLASGQQPILDGLWEEGNFMEYFVEAIEYLLSLVSLS